MFDRLLRYVKVDLQDLDDLRYVRDAQVDGKRKRRDGVIRFAGIVVVMANARAPLDKKRLLHYVK